MKAFTFVRPASLAEAASEAAKPGSVVKAGGTDLLDRMKERVDEPDRVVWLGDAVAEFRALASDPNPPESVTLHALTTLAEIAASKDVARACPALAEAAALAASPQIRARATLGGNLLQHTRCGYYRLASFPCFKRGDERCLAREEGGVQDNAAIFANSPCASAHPSSLAPVLCAADARVLRHAAKRSESGLGSLYVAPRRGVAADHVLGPGELLYAVVIPVVPGRRIVYEEIRQKAAFDWALVSCAARVDMDGDKVRAAGIWIGSVAPTPWQAKAAESALVGKTLDDATIRAASAAAADGATPLPGNAYKVDLVKVCVRRALERLRAAK